MQTEISLFTVEGKHVALSQVMRDVILFMDQMHELDDVFGEPRSKQKSIAHYLRITMVY